ncbi:hypothetical protein GGI21_005601 [Coemansia aciculifera]|nr:hypothetical protein GGI21_005601 [Coemansia aciculifera]
MPVARPVGATCQKRPAEDSVPKRSVRPKIAKDDSKDVPPPHCLQGRSTISRLSSTQYQAEENGPSLFGLHRRGNIALHNVVRAEEGHVEPSLQQHHESVLHQAEESFELASGLKRHSGYVEIGRNIRRKLNTALAVTISCYKAADPVVDYILGRLKNKCTGYFSRNKHKSRSSYKVGKFCRDRVTKH